MPKYTMSQAAYDARIRDVAKRFNKGESLEDLANAYHTRRAWVRRWLEEAGISTTFGACIGLDDVKLAQALARKWRARTPIRAIVRETGLSEPRVTELLAAAGVDTSMHWDRREPDDDEIVRGFLAGQPRITITDLASRVGFRVSVVRRSLEKAGIRSRRCLIGFTRTEVADALAARRRFGISVSRLAADTGIDMTRISELSRPAGAKSRRRRSELTMTSAQLAKAYKRGSSIAELAERVGSSKNMIRNILLDAGVTMRPSTKRPRD